MDAPSHIRWAIHSRHTDTKHKQQNGNLRRIEYYRNQTRIDVV